jgi:tetratricopeptide (TPR) repeat protein
VNTIEERRPSDPVYAPPALGKPPLLSAIEEEDSIIVAPDAALRPMRVPQITVDTGMADDAQVRRTRARAQTLRLADRRPPVDLRAAPKSTSQPPLAATVAPALRRRPKRLKLGRLLLFVMLVAGGAAGTQQYLRHRQHTRVSDRVRGQLDEVVKLLRSSNPPALTLARKELDALERQSALRQSVAQLKMRHRILQLIATRETVSDLEQSVAAASAARVPAKALAAGHVASKLARQDWAGALDAVSKWQDAAAQDPYFQLAAGAAMERVGDRAALERYNKAWQLDPKFTIAAVLLARLALVETGVATARRQIGRIRAELGPRPESSALLGLLWAFDAERAERFPSEAELVARDTLPAPLDSAVKLTNARRALVEGKLDAAREHVRSALAVADSPFMLGPLGFLGLEAQSDALATDAAARLQQLDLDDTTATVLRARASLMSGRIEQAREAIAKVKDNKKSVSARVQVALVRAIAAYELLDAVALAQVLGQLDATDAALSVWTAVADAPRALSGKELPPVSDLGQIQRSSAVWGDVIAVDIALAYGDVSEATAIIDKWIELDDRPLHLLRVARLRRYEQKYVQAKELCELAASSIPVTPAVVIERTLALFSLDKPRMARRWINNNKQVPDSIRSWLLALITAQESGRGLASLIVRKLALPDDNAPLALRLVAARVLALTRDARAGEFVGELAQSIPNNPDVRWAQSMMK